MLCNQPPCFLTLEREVEEEYRAPMLARLQQKVNAVAASHSAAPRCVRCNQPMGHQDTRRVSWIARCGRLFADVSRNRCSPCHYECRPLLEQLGIEPGRISGSLARLLALLAVVAPYPLAAQFEKLWECGGWRNGWAKRPRATAKR